jgi:phage terminase large subunit-like protein
MSKNSPNQSKASWIASQNEAVRAEFYASLNAAERAFLPYDWDFWGRDDQKLPPGDWFVWLILAGRGWGKTRTAVECITRMLLGPTPLIAPPDAPEMLTVVADSPFDMRQYSIEGPSGFLNVGPPDRRPLYEPSKKTLTWPNGCKALLFSSEDPETLRGASGEFFWWDELVKSRYAQEGWDNMLFGMREGTPRGIVTTTPRPLPIVRELRDRPSTHVTVGSTWENKENLSPTFYREVIAPFEGTRLGRQEINAEILDEAEGALWTRDMIVQVREHPSLLRVVVGVDPPVAVAQQSRNDGVQRRTDQNTALCGIVVVGLGLDGRGYVLADYSGRMLPAQWGKKAVQAYDDWHADRIVAYGRRLSCRLLRLQGCLGPVEIHHVWRTRSLCQATRRPALCAWRDALCRRRAAGRLARPGGAMRA